MHFGLRIGRTREFALADDDEADRGNGFGGWCCDALLIAGIRRPATNAGSDDDRARFRDAAYIRGF